MTELKDLQPVIDACSPLTMKMGCDFIGLAIQNGLVPDVQWHYAYGNRNEKYQRITVRYGKGIAGKVISTGSPLLISDFPNGILGKAQEYPIMLAEHLVSSYAAPIFFNGVPKGVLLVGKRTGYKYLEEEQTEIRNAAKKLEEIVKDLYRKC